MIAELYALLVQATLAISLATLAILMLRRLLRRAFGARVAYGAWVMVPLALATVLLPQPEPSSLPMVAPMVVPSASTIAATAQLDASWWLPILVAAWIAGALALFATGLIRQWRFQRSLGDLRPRDDGSLQSPSSRIGPAVIGLWHGRIVVPADFDSRYTERERDLILGHERVHLARHDLLLNLSALAIRCLNWFNPLVHVAVRCFRFDQELAVDALVLAHRPEDRRSYADAMLKSQLSAFPSPLGCHWQSAHPLKERIAMLKRPVPGIARFALGIAVAGALSLTLVYAAWAAQPIPIDAIANPPTYARIKPPRYPQTAIDVRAEGTALLRVLVGVDGKPEQVEVDTSTGTPALDEAAITAVRGWMFNAGNDGNKPASTWVHVPIRFAMSDDALENAPKFEGEGVLDEIYIRNR